MRNAEWNTRNPKSEIRNPHLNGFTLLEVMLAMAILTVIMTVIYASFSSAGRNVEQAETSRDRTDLARTLIAKMSDDIANAYYNPAMKEAIFYGKKSTTVDNEPRFDGIALTALTNWRKPDSKETDLWEVGYRFETAPEGQGQVLVRREKRDLDKDRTPLEGGTDMIITDRIKELRLRYYDGTTSTWKEEWDTRTQGRLPKAVEIRLVLEDGPAFLTSVEAGR
jgi:general secretion pathway protein J